MRTVPAGIARPEYAATGQPSDRASRAIRTDDEIQAMRIAGQVAADALIEVGRHVRPGITTEELDRIGHEAMVAAGSYPSTLNYRGFPKSLCTSVNEIVCHGIPDSRRLQDGDIVNIDVTAFIGGVHGDTSCTFLVGDVDDASVALVERTRQAMHAGISVVRPGARIHQIGRAIEESVAPFGYSVVREFIGHGIGDQFHTSLQIPHYYDPRNDTVLLPGMTFTIEPMINIGGNKLEMWDDGWTVTTKDLQRTAQFEHTILVTEAGHELLDGPGRRRAGRGAVRGRSAWASTTPLLRPSDPTRPPASAASSVLFLGPFPHRAGPARPDVAQGLMAVAPHVSGTVGSIVARLHRVRLRIATHPVQRRAARRRLGSWIVVLSAAWLVHHQLQAADQVRRDWGQDASGGGADPLRRARRAHSRRGAGGRTVP